MSIEPETTNNDLSNPKSKLITEIALTIFIRFPITYVVDRFLSNLKQKKKKPSFACTIGKELISLAVSNSITNQIMGK